jgi:hypothetical protein
MPYKIRKKDGKYEVRSPSGVRAKGTTKKKAEAQVRLLYAIEEDEDFLEKRKKRNKV